MDFMNAQRFSKGGGGVHAGAASAAVMSGRTFAGTFMVALLLFGMGKSATYLISVYKIC